MLKPNPSLYIPCEFIHKDGPTLRAGNWEDLAMRVAQYREVNRLPAGEPLKEIYAQICSRNPDKCQGGPGNIMISDQPLNKRILSWVTRLVEWYNSGTLVRVSAEVAEERARICNACPYAAEWRATCDSCRNTVDACERAVFGDSRSETIMGLRGCRVLGEDPRASVCIVLPPTIEAPEHCWRHASA